MAYFLTDTTTPVQVVGEMNQREVGRTTFEIAECEVRNDNKDYDMEYCSDRGQ